MFKIKNLIYSIGLASLMAFSSCADFLEVGPTNALPGKTAVTNVDEARSALNGVYTKLMDRYYYGTDMITYGDVRGDDQGTTKSGDRTQSMYTYGHLTALTSTNGGYFWETIYSGLSRANDLITKIEAGDIKIASTEEQIELDNIYGQVLTLRALMHFDLVRIYGEPYLKDETAPGIIIADHIITKDEKLPRKSVKDTYNFIVDDLRKATGKDGGPVYLSKEIDVVYKQANFSYYGAEALLSKIYLYMGKWSESYEAAKSVITNGPYSLISGVDYVASWSSEFTTESIFEVWSSSTENANREGIGSVTAPNMYAAVSATPQFITLMKEDMDDVRLGVMKKNSQNEEYAYVAKYPGRGGDIYVNNTRVLRLSEIYLIAAEAGVLAGKSDASTYLNDIRKRANPSAANVTATVDLVMKERRKELVGEGHRYFDIIRNLGTRTVSRLGTSSYPIAADYMVKELSWNDEDYSYLLILPIPQSEIEVNKDIKQNAGYPIN